MGTLTPMPHELLEARSRAYALMARLFLRGVDAVAWTRVLELPEFLAGMEAGEIDLDELAAEHHHTRDFNGEM